MARVFVLPDDVDEDDLKSGKNRLSIPLDAFGRPTAPYGTQYFRPIQVGFVDWKTMGVSFTFPVTVTEGEDEGFTAELYPSANKAGAWKLGNTLDAIGVPYGVNDKGKIQFDPDECETKLGTGVWEVQVGYKGGVQSEENKVKQLKFVAILPPDYVAPNADTKQLV